MSHLLYHSWYKALSVRAFTTASTPNINHSYRNFPSKSYLATWGEVLKGTGAVIYYKI